MKPSELVAKLDRGAQRVKAEVQRVMVGAALDIEARAKSDFTTKLRVRTGLLRRSIAARVEAGEKIRLVASAGGRVGAKDVVYASTHEFGATIRPKNAKALRIPIPGGPALTAAGVDRYATPLRQTAGGMFRLVKFGGKAFLRKTGKGGGLA